jgi:hypothetical protein
LSSKALTITPSDAGWVCRGGRDTGYTCLGYATIIFQSGPDADDFYGHLYAIW